MFPAHVKYQSRTAFCQLEQFKNICFKRTREKEEMYTRSSHKEVGAIITRLHTADFMTETIRKEKQSVVS